MRRPAAVTALTIAIALGTAGSVGAGPDPALAASCHTQSSSVSVTLDESKYPGTTDHVHDAVAAGKPSLLHIDRADADAHRDQSLKGIPTKSGYDRDEYPPAASREGGTGADVRYVVSSDNRGAGSSMGNQLEPYCEGQAFRITLVP